jgi:ribonuclease R
MIAANETVAENYFWLESPFVYRSHEEPDPEKFIRLREFVACFSYTLKGQHPSSIQALLAKAEGSPEEHIINRMVLQSLKQARYTSQSLGHFGLASKYYCHFTSPIRRYPDLQIHRIIKESLSGSLTKVRRKHYNEILTEIAKQSSERERRAEETEREVNKLKKAEYMGSHLGEIYDGVISGVTAWGFYVELPNTVEGLVHIRTIRGDYFIFDERTMRLVGRRNGSSYRLGQPVKVWVKAADKWSRLIDFELV